MTGTTIHYNGVFLRNCETKSFSQSMEYDDSKTDLCFHRFRMRVKSTLVTFAPGVADHTSTIYPGQPSSASMSSANDGTAGSIAERIRLAQRLLGQPRKLFHYYYENAVGNGTSPEPFIATNGPQPPENTPPVVPELSDLMLIAVGPLPPTPVPPQTANPQPGAPPNMEPQPAMVPLLPRVPGAIGTQSQNMVQADHVIDVDNGPKPIDVDVVEIFGQKSMSVEFEIEVCRVLCDPIPQPDPYPHTEPNLNAEAVANGVAESLEMNSDELSPPASSASQDDEADQRDEAAKQIMPSKRILSNRWSMIETKDSKFITTRTIQGTLRVRDKTQIPHLARCLVIPPLLRGYQRVKQEFEDDPTGLILKYRITDKERHEAPPSPAIDWDGYYAESTSAKGVAQFAECKVKLIGPPGGDKQALLAACGRVINSRLSGRVNERFESEAFKVTDSNNSVILLPSSIVEVLGSPNPIIEMTVRVQYVNTERRSLAMRTERIGERVNKTETPSGNGDAVDNAEGRSDSVPHYRRDEWPVPYPYDSSNPIGVFACYLQDPCSCWHSPVNWPADLAKPYGPDEPHDTPEGEPESDPNQQTSPGGGGSNRRLFLGRPGHNSQKGSLDRDERTLPELPNIVMTRFDKEFGQDTVDITASQFQGDPYTNVRIQSTYKTRTGIVALPYSAPLANGDTVHHARFDAGETKRILEMEATRIGAFPQAPAPLLEVVDPNGIREFLLTHDEGYMAPEFSAQGDGPSRSCSVKLRYVYSLTRVIKPEDKRRLAISPIDATPGETRFIDTGELFNNQRAG